MAFYFSERGFVFEHRQEKSGVLTAQATTEHIHADSYELMYVVSRGIFYSIEGRQHPIEPHTMIVIHPGEKHRVTVARGSSINWYMIRFPINDPPAHLLDMLDMLGNIYNVPGTRIAEEFERMDVYSREIMSRQIINVLIHQLGIILNYACNIVGMHRVASAQTGGSKNALFYINEHLTSIHTVSDICSNLHLSPSTLQKIVEAETGMSVMTYVRQQKCKLAHTLLMRGNPATDVAKQCGFGNYSTFYRVYVAEFGTMPSGTLQKKEDGLKV